MTDLAIQVENISKKYQLGRKSEGSISEKIKGLFIGNNVKREEFWALRDVSFEIQKGEAVGIIGRNGAGKSTLLKVLSRITHPTSGKFIMNGRVSSLLEVGTGFHPELSGRENIFLNGTILGMSRNEIKSKLDEIVDFSGVSKFLDTPVKHYSSGMYVRLAFSVAAHLEPEILIIDEVLAVGDSEFQKKCLGKMGEVTKQGRTVLFVSHNMQAVENLCHQAILIKGGVVVDNGSTTEIIKKYLHKNLTVSDNIVSTSRSGSGLIKFESLVFLDFGQNRIDKLVSGQDIIIEARLVSDVEVDLNHLQIDFGINNELGIRVAWFSTTVAEVDNTELLEYSFKINLIIPRIPLQEGTYSLTLYAVHKGQVVDWIVDAYAFEVNAGDFFGSQKLLIKNSAPILVPHKFKYEKIS